jgi:hypothetical protein
LLNRLIDKLEKKCQRKMGGIPMLWVIYKPDKPVPNMEFRLHPMFKDDIALNTAFKDIADYMRDKYLEAEEG